MICLAGLSCKEIEEFLIPLPKFRAKQIYNWIIRGAKSLEEMTDLPAALREELGKSFSVFSSAIKSERRGESAKKIALELQDGAKIEAVLLNDGKERHTACLSTQAGCGMACVFCKTGALGFKRNLTSYEIIEQFLHLRDKGQGTKDKKNMFESFDKNTITNPPSPQNIVIMGMGEPLLNLTELRKALAFFTDKRGLNFSRRRITASTCGIASGLLDIAKNGPYIRLALSLTTGDEDLRAKLMPVTNANPLRKVKEALLLFQKNGGGRVTLEIPLLGEINTRKKDAESVFAFSYGLECVVNIIPWNPAEGLNFNGKPLEEPSKKETAAYIEMLESFGLKATVRYKKGRGVSGACGQLGAES